MGNIFKQKKKPLPMLNFITSNQHKHAEIQKMTHLPIVQKKVDYPEIQADTLEEVAQFGVEYCYSVVKEPCFVEDSGLFIEALKGFPGVYSKYVLMTVGCEGILRLLDENRKASFKSVIAYADGRNTQLFAGEVKGRIAERKKGLKGFGFDPIFIPEGENRTFAEMDTEEKNSYSHRGKAFATFIKYVEQVR